MQRKLFRTEIIEGSARWNVKSLRIWPETWAEGWCVLLLRFHKVWWFSWLYLTSSFLTFSGIWLIESTIEKDGRSSDTRIRHSLLTLRYLNLFIVGALDVLHFNSILTFLHQSFFKRLSRWNLLFSIKCHISLRETPLGLFFVVLFRGFTYL